MRTRSGGVLRFSISTITTRTDWKAIPIVRLDHSQLRALPSGVIHKGITKV